MRPGLAGPAEGGGKPVEPGLGSAEHELMLQTRLMPTPGLVKQGISEIKQNLSMELNVSREAASNLQYILLIDSSFC